MPRKNGSLSSLNGASRPARQETVRARLRWDWRDTAGSPGYAVTRPIRRLEYSISEAAWEALPLPSREEPAVLLQSFPYDIMMGNGAP